MVVSPACWILTEERFARYVGPPAMLIAVRTLRPLSHIYTWFQHFPRYEKGPQVRNCYSYFRIFKIFATEFCGQRPLELGLCQTHGHNREGNLAPRSSSYPPLSSSSPYTVTLILQPASRARFPLKYYQWRR